MFRIVPLAFTLALSASAHAGFLIQIDLDGAVDSFITFNPHFDFGGGTTAVSTSVGASAFGTTAGNSIFGGNGVNLPDTYIYVYNPRMHADNLVIPFGTHLGDGVFGSGVVGGGNGMYRVYALWPFSINVSGGLTTYDVVAPGDHFSVSLDQNNRGNEWVLLGTIDYTGGVITVRQIATSNTLVSMRAHSILFERVVTPCAGDLNNDGVTNGEDLAQMLTVWGTNNVVADLNEDGTVDGVDLATLLATWGLCV